MTWPFYPFLSGNSGVTPPYAKTPQGSSWPYYTGNGGGAKLPVPYSPKPMVPFGGAGLPVPTTAPGLPVPTGGAGLPAVTGQSNGALDLAKQLMTRIATSGGSSASSLGGSLLSRIGGPLGMLLGMTSPAGDANDNGQGALLTQPTFPNGVPLPQARPLPQGISPEDLGNPYAGGSTVPLPQPRPPQMAMAQAPATGQLPDFSPFAAAPMGGPGSMSFGAGDGPSGNADGQSNLLAMLIKSLQQGR